MAEVPQAKSKPLWGPKPEESKVRFDTSQPLPVVQHSKKQAHSHIDFQKVFDSASTLDLWKLKEPAAAIQSP